MADRSPELAIDAFFKQLSPCDTLCVAVSGGSDSTALLHLLHQYLADHEGPRLVAVTVDHGLRTAARDEAQQVAALCATLNIQHHIVIWDGQKSKTGVQDAARNARYALLRQTALACGAGAIVTAHTRDDQVETIRMRRRRGTGRGLSGMAQSVLYNRDCWILRPLLEVRKQALRDHLKQAGIGWLDDPSNLDRRYERVRIRLDESNPAEDDELLSMVSAMTQARHKEAESLGRFLKDNVIVHADMIVELPQVPEILSDHLQQAVALMAALMGGRAYLPGARSQDQIARFCAGGGAPRITLSRSVLDRRAQSIFIYRETRGLPRMSIEPDSTIVWDGRHQITNLASSGAILIGPAGKWQDPSLAELPGNVPPGVISRARGAQPVIISSGDVPVSTNAVSAAGQASISRYLTHFDLFLPDFECMVANSCATVFGLPAYPPSPL